MRISDWSSDVCSSDLVILVGATTLPVAAQAPSGPFGGFKHDRSAPIEITSDALEVRQAEQLAICSGDVVAGQGTLRLTADRVERSAACRGGRECVCTCGSRLSQYKSKNKTKTE